jgi:hypothetical protein
MRTLGHRSSAALTSNGRRVTAFSVPWRLDLLPLVLCQLLCKIILLFLCYILVQLDRGTGIGVVIALELFSLGPQEAM